MPAILLCSLTEPQHIFAEARRVTNSLRRVRLTSPLSTLCSRSLLSIAVGQLGAFHKIKQVTASEEQKAIEEHSPSPGGKPLFPGVRRLCSHTIVDHHLVTILADCSLGIYWSS